MKNEDILITNLIKMDTILELDFRKLSKQNTEGT